MKTYFKVIMRGFRGNVAKLVSLIVIMALGIAFVAGLARFRPPYSTASAQNSTRETLPTL